MVDHQDDICNRRLKYVEEKVDDAVECFELLIIS